MITTVQAVTSVFVTAQVAKRLTQLLWSSGETRRAVLEAYGLYRTFLDYELDYRLQIDLSLEVISNGPFKLKKRNVQFTYKILD